jgi:DNA primase
MMYHKESLELLRQRIDLAEVLSAHIQLQRSGSSFKACCPFHEEKSPSFVVQKGDTHYHCYGCGAHGDAIAFLMSYLKMSFVEAVESLAERFQVTLEKTEESEERKGPSKTTLKHALDKACRFYQFALLKTEEGHAALKYLYQRGITLDFINHFQVGYAPKEPHLLQRVLREQGFDDAILEMTGLLRVTQSGKKRDFFSERITFPICEASGSVIGFSARKFKEETFGGKYINSPETPLFKKSQTLYGLSHCRQRIAKERRVIVVEGQLDALQLIYAGFNFTVAGQGTAFGEGHVLQLLNLGINHVFLALDGDQAGQEAAVKIGHLFQKKGVEVSVVPLPAGKDPDDLLKTEGPPAFQRLMDESVHYLPFLFKHLSKKLDLQSPSKKSELVQLIATRIREWDQPVMVHESLRKLAELARVPEEMIGTNQIQIPDTYIKKSSRVDVTRVDPHRILEGDLLRWLFFMGESMPHLLERVRINLTPEHFRSEACRRLFTLYFDAYAQNQPRDLLSLAVQMDEGEEQLLLSEIMQKKVNLQKAEEGLTETIRKLLIRSWMDERESIKAKIHSGAGSDEEILELAKQFDEIRKKTPEVRLP